ncbi:MAG: hypothetical protein V1746_06260, partial [bacterium]
MVATDRETNEKRFASVAEIDKMLICIRITAQNLGKLKGSSQHADKVLWQAFNSSMDYNNNTMTGD